MKRLLGAVCAAAIAFVSPGTAEAKGCIKGAAVGGTKKISLQRNRRFLVI
jgi:hypothetical protein